MHVEQRSVHLIKPYEKNPRLNDAAVDRVAESIRQFGFRQPIVVNAAGVIVVGHTRYLAALKLELETVPVHVAAKLTAAQAAAYRIVDNKLGELAQWDLELLSSELAALEALDFDLDVLGFEDDELAQLLGEEIQTGLTDPDQIPRILRTRRSRNRATSGCWASTSRIYAACGITSWMAWQKTRPPAE